MTETFCQIIVWLIQVEVYTSLSMNWYSLSKITTLFKRQYVTVDMSSNSSRKLMANELEMIQSIDKLLPLDIKYP